MGAPVAGHVLHEESVLHGVPSDVDGIDFVHALMQAGPTGNRLVTMCTGETARELAATFDPLADSACPACRVFMIDNPE